VALEKFLRVSSVFSIDSAAGRAAGAGSGIDAAGAGLGVEAGAAGAGLGE
jgi:hypothetical protein